MYEKFLNGDNNSLEKLLFKYKNNLIYFICRYVKYREVAEDIFQEVVVFILENKSYYNSKYSFKTYIYMIAKSKALDYIKKMEKMLMLSTASNMKFDIINNKFKNRLI